MYRADIERRGAEHIMTRHIEVEILQRRYGTRCFVDGVDPFLRHGAVSRHPFGFRLQPKRPLVADERLVAGWLRYDESTNLA